MSAWDLLSDGEAMDDFIETHLHRSRTDRCVVHCYLSMQRGPSVASRMIERLAQLDNPELIDPSNVTVLSKGFRGFWAIFRDDEDLVVKAQ